MDKQVLKSGLQDFVKSTKGNTQELYPVRFNNGGYWIYNGLLLTTKTFNLNYAVLHNKVKAAQIKKDEVYIINTLGIQDNQRKLFGL